MSFQNILVTPSTSLILIKTNNVPQNIYLSTFNVPDFKVSVRDTTGLLSQNNFITVNTIGGARFNDGTTQYLLNSPYGLVNLSLRTSTIWQVLHTSGQRPSESAANVNTINISTLYVSQLSTQQQFVSTLVVENVFTPNSIVIQSPFIITNLSTTGLVSIGSTLNVYGNVYQQGNINVSGATRFLSSANILDISTLRYPISISSFLGVGGSTFVRDVVEIGSTLRIQSTAQVSTVSVNLDTIEPTVIVERTMQIKNYASIQSSLTTGFSTILGNSLFINGAISSLQGDLITGYIEANKSVLIQKSLSVITNARFFDDVYIQSTLTILNSAIVTSSVSVTGTISTQAFFTNGLSTTGGISTSGPLVVLSSLFVENSASTNFISSGQLLSVGKDLFITSSISSLLGFSVGGDTSVLGSAILDTASIGGSLGVGGNLAVLGNLYTQDAVYEGDVTIRGDVNVKGFTFMNQSASVRSTLSVEGNMFIKGNTTISSFAGVNSFLLSNLDVTTSSPYVTVTTLNLNASTIRAPFVWIQTDAIEVNIAQLSSVLTSSLAASSLFTQTTLVDTFRYGANETLLNDTQRELYMNIPTYFYKGFSSIEIQTSTMDANSLNGGYFIGDGFNLSNISNPFIYLSAFTLQASTVTANEIYTSTLYADTLDIDVFGNVQSSLISKYLLVLPEGSNLGSKYSVPDSTGFSEPRDYNSFVAITPQKMAVNNALFFDQTNFFVGIGVSSPKVDLDVSGNLYCVNLFYSSINNITFSGDILGFETVGASSILARDNYQYGYLSVPGNDEDNGGLRGGGLLFPIFIGNKTDPVNIRSFPIQTTSSISAGETDYGGGFTTNSGILDNFLFSSIYLHNIKIDNIQRRVLFGAKETYNPLLTNDLEIFSDNPVRFNVPVGNGLRATIIETSTVNIDKSLLTTQLDFPNLSLFGISSPTIAKPTNTFTTYLSTLVIDDLLSATLNIGGNIDGRNVGIKTTQPQKNMDVRGNAYFSTLYLNKYMVDSLSLNYQNL